MEASPGSDGDGGDRRPARRLQAETDEPFDDFDVLHQAAGILAQREGITADAGLSEITRRAAGAGLSSVAFARRLVGRQTGRPKVLYVDDEPANGALMRRLFERHAEIDLEVATTGVAGLFLARQFRPDAMIVDLNLPDIDGAEMIRVLQADPGTVGIPAIVLTADVSRSASDSLRSGAVAHLTKPFEIAGLLAEVDRAIAPPAG
jgi:CheY-like chemotaxis protein